MRFADLTTLRVGGEISRFIDGTSEEIILNALKNDPTVQVIGGGSNILVSDEAFKGTVLKISTNRSQLDYDSCAGGMITVDAGVSWDDFVAHTVSLSKQQHLVLHRDDEGRFRLTVDHV